MLNKIQIFILTLIALGQLIKNNIVKSIPLEIYNEFSFVFFITSLMYFILKYLLNKYKTSFREINPSHKKMYVVKNYVKSFFLAGLCLNLGKFFDLLNGVLDLMFIKRCAVYYVMNDIIGLLLVKKLPTTTKIHHITTSLCSLAIVMKEHNNIDIITLIVLYAVFSSISFCVNFYLGHRIYSSNIKFKYFLSYTSFWIYLISSIVCWIFQLFMAFKVIPTVPLWHTISYFMFLYSVGRDDIILIKWLHNDKNNYEQILNN
jgi:drug/metabolite transporter (DMT)-like permease